MRFPRLWPWKPRRTVVVDPVQVAMLNFLLRFGAASVDDLFEEVRNTHPVERDVFTAAVSDAVAQELVDYRFDPERDATLLALTGLGERLRDKLPAASRSRLSVYV